MINRVKQLGGKTCKFKVPAEAGHPDRLVKLPNKPAALLELKRPRKEPEPLQYVRLIEWTATGMLAGWANTKEQVDAFLQQVLAQ